MEVVSFQQVLFLLMAILDCASAESLVRLNAGLVVTRGQSVFVTDKELELRAPGDTDACKVEVILNEPVTQRVGKLTPQVRVAGTVCLTVIQYPRVTHSRAVLI